MEITEKEMLEEIAIGVNMKYEDLLYIYSGIKNKGFVSKVDLKQLAGRGIPIYQALSKLFQIPLDLISINTHSFDGLSKAMFSMVEPGGIFHGLKKASENTLQAIGERFAVACEKEGIDSMRINSWTHEATFYYKDGRIETFKY